MSVLTPERTLPVAPPASPTKAEPNVVQKQLLQIRAMVEAGLWCRNEGKNRRGQHCIRGMSAHYGHMYTLDPYLDAAIPPEGREELRVGGHSKHANGGFYRGSHYTGGRVAGYSNTRRNETEVIAWIDRAIEIAETQTLSPTYT